MVVSQYFQGAAVVSQYFHFNTKLGNTHVGASARAASRDANTNLGNTHVGASARAASREAKGARTAHATGCSLPRLGPGQRTLQASHFHYPGGKSFSDDPGAGLSSCTWGGMTFAWLFGHVGTRTLFWYLVWQCGSTVYVVLVVLDLWWPYGLLGAFWRWPFVE